MLDKHYYVPALACCVLALAPADATSADDAAEGPAEQCVDMRRISSTEIIDDQNILFHMRGGVIYRNKLSHSCPGLAREQTFMYRTSLSQLCNVDIITVLDNHGFGFTPGPSCGLGKFYPITKDEAEALKKSPKIKNEPIEPPEPSEMD